LGLGFVMIGGFLKKSLTLTILGAHNSFNSNMFLTIFNVPDAPIGGV
jgi:hypothetical protein